MSWSVADIDRDGIRLISLLLGFVIGLHIVDGLLSLLYFDTGLPTKFENLESQFKRIFVDLSWDVYLVRRCTRDPWELKQLSYHTALYCTVLCWTVRKRKLLMIPWPKSNITFVVKLGIFKVGWNLMFGKRSDVSVFFVWQIDGILFDVSETYITLLFLNIRLCCSAVCTCFRTVLYRISDV